MCKGVETGRKWYCQFYANFVGDLGGRLDWQRKLPNSLLSQVWQKPHAMQYQLDYFIIVYWFMYSLLYGINGTRGKTTNPCLITSLLNCRAEIWRPKIYDLEDQKRKFSTLFFLCIFVQTLIEMVLTFGVSPRCSVRSWKEEIFVGGIASKWHRNDNNWSIVLRFREKWRSLWLI